MVACSQTVVPGLTKNLLTGLGNKPDAKEVQLEMVCMDVLKVTLLEPLLVTACVSVLARFGRCLCGLPGSLAFPLARA